MVDVVLDTNVLVAALRSSKGASYLLLTLLGDGRFTVHLSVPLVLEYEEVAKREASEHGLTYSDIDAIIDFLCKVGIHHEIDFLWRPYLKDPDDDFLLELAVQGNCPFIVTYNEADFAGTGKFGVTAITPRDFLRVIGERP